ncbi:hypothetical protein ACH9L7_00440 [Haloferax sp. S1W]|uniref:hypothetical protein n=1 Tax=Haloferax sp. S1W TaxID=3377110 RepID=UPI0037C7C7F6
MAPTRRQILATASAALAGLSGCSGTPGQSDETTTTDVSAHPAATANGTTSETANETASETTDDTPPETEPTTQPSAPEDITFEGSDGRTVHATRYGSGDCGVVLVPQINLDRESWESQARLLAREGYLALAIDEGESDKFAGVEGAIEYLRTEASVDHVVLVGASSGGEAAVVAASQTTPPVAGVVGLSAAGGTDVVADIDAPSLFVVGSGDADRFVQTARTLVENAPDPTAHVAYETDAHGQALFDSNGDELRTRLLSFVADTCDAGGS